MRGSLGRDQLLVAIDKPTVTTSWLHRYCIDAASMLRRCCIHVCCIDAATVSSCKLMSDCTSSKKREAQRTNTCCCSSVLGHTSCTLFLKLRLYNMSFGVHMTVQPPRNQYIRYVGCCFSSSCIVLGRASQPRLSRSARCCNKAWLLAAQRLYAASPVKGVARLGFVVHST